MTNGFKLYRTRPGEWHPHIPGSGIHRPAKEIARRDSILVLKEPGHSFNASGIRGMPHMIYQPATMHVLRIIGPDREDADTLELERLISYPASQRAADK